MVRIILWIRRIKEFLRINEKGVMLVISFTCVFLLGFFTGKVDSLNANQPIIKIEKSDSNFSILKDAAPVVQETSSQGAQGDVLGTSCKIKGNVSASGKIYHVPGGSSYNRTQPEMCFNTEAEAQTAGFRKAIR